MTMLDLPPEIWNHIFSFFSSVNELVDSSVVAWARIASNDALHLNIPNRTVVENSETKRALGLVSRAFYGLSRPIVLEYIAFRKIGPLRCLARQVRERPELVGVMGRCTKRIDVQLGPVDPQGRILPLISTTDSRPDEREYHRLLEDLETILKACPNVTYFTYRVCDGSSTRGDRTVLDIVRDSCPHVEVIRYDAGHPYTASPHYELPRFPKLRVLEFAGTGTVESAARRETCEPELELPFLHTLIGTMDLICAKVRGAHLPALNTIICKPWIPLPYSTAGRDVIRQFFSERSRLIRSFDMRFEHPDNFVREYLHFVNATEVVLPLDTANSTYIGPFSRPFNNLQTIGLADSGPSSGDQMDAASYMFQSIISQKEQRNLANLKTIRVIGEQLVRRLRERKGMEIRLVERRLRGWGVVLEDGYGRLLVF